ncbi:MAG: hypothetical protein ACERKZ_03915 [Lachnotalea sp.]
MKQKQVLISFILVLLVLRYMKTDEFWDYAHFRNGVEAIPSLLSRRYKVDKIPTHGKKQTRFYFGFKIAALNFQGTNQNQIFITGAFDTLILII